MVIGEFKQGFANLQGKRWEWDFTLCVCVCVRGGGGVLGCVYRFFRERGERGWCDLDEDSLGVLCFLLFIFSNIQKWSQLLRVSVISAGDGVQLLYPHKTNPKKKSWRFSSVRVFTVLKLERLTLSADTLIWFHRAQQHGKQQEPRVLLRYKTWWLPSMVLQYFECSNILVCKLKRGIEVLGNKIITEKILVHIIGPTMDL